MTEAILNGYNSLVKSDGNAEFTIVPPAPYLHSYTKIKRWWNQSYDKVTYTGCALISYRDAYVVVSCDANVLLKIIADNNNELTFNVIFKNQGDGGIRRILVCPKTELYNLVNYDDYYYDYSDKQIKRVKHGNGGLDLFASATLDLQFSANKSLVDAVSNKNLITFSRSSGTGYGATYVDSDGLIKTSPVNLFTYSEQFDQWTVGSNSVITPNCIAAPDGSMTADRVQFSSSLSTYMQKPNVLTSGSVFTGSVWVKAVTPGTNDQFTFEYGSSSGTSATSYFTATGEWQRVSSTVTAVGTTFNINNKNDVFASDIYLWGAQLEEGVTTPSDYIPTQGTASGAPRFDHDPVTGESLGLLIEEERTNSLLSSESFTGFNGDGVTVSTSTEVNPEGNASCKRIQAIANYGAHRLRKSDSIAGDATVSCFVKMDTHRYVTIGWGGVSHNFSAVFDIHPDVTGDRLLSQSGLGSFTNIKAGYENYLNGWVRIWASGSTIATGGWAVSIALDENASSMLAWTASGTESIFIWGGQHEDGKEFPTSYIPTTGSTVTRSPDIVSIEGNKFAKTNLISYSERFEQSAWLKTSTTVIPNNLVAPDGSQTAELVLDETTSISHIIKQTTPTLKNATDYTFSVYVKAASLNYCFLGFYQPSGGMPTGFASFDLVNNTSSIASGSPVANIQDVGNGWKRIAITETTTSAATTRFDFRLSQDGVWNNRVYTGSGQGVYLWGAQLEEGDEMTEYTPSVESFVSRQSGTGYGSTYVDDATGLITVATPGAARYENGELLLEPARTNLLKNSSGNTGTGHWTAYNMQNPTTVDGPAGPNTAYQNLSTGGTIYSRIIAGTNNRFTSVIEKQYVASCYVKPVNYNVVAFGISANGWGSSGNNSRCVFDLSTGSVTSLAPAAQSARAIPAGNGWYRLEVVTIAATIVGSNIVYLDLGSTLAEPHTTDQGFQVYGLQIEEGLFATSLIPTSNSTATRAQDVSDSTLGVASWYNQSEGTVFAKSSYFGLSSASTGRIYDINDGTTLNRHHLIIRGANNDLRVQTRKDSVDGFSESFSIPAANNFFSNALGYKLNDCASSLDGGNTVNDNTVLIPTVDRMFIGARDLSSAYLNGHISHLAYFPTRKTDQELINITTDYTVYPYGRIIRNYPYDLGQLPNEVTRRIDIEVEYGIGAVYDLNPIS